MENNTSLIPGINNRYLLIVLALIMGGIIILLILLYIKISNKSNTSNTTNDQSSNKTDLLDFTSNYQYKIDPYQYNPYGIGYVNIQNINLDDTDPNNIVGPVSTTTQSCPQICTLDNTCNGYYIGNNNTCKLVKNFSKAVHIPDQSHVSGNGFGTTGFFLKSNLIKKPPLVNKYTLYENAAFNKSYKIKNSDGKPSTTADIESTDIQNCIKTCDENPKCSGFNINRNLTNCTFIDTNNLNKNDFNNNMSRNVDGLHYSRQILT